MPASGTPPQPDDQAGSTDSTNHRPRRRRRPAVRLVLLTVIAVLLGASQAAPAVHLDPPDLSGLPEGAYVALGDSYASGFGVPPYAEGTDVTGGNTCRRSAGSYAHIVSTRMGRTLEMGACSGARTRSFYEAKTPGKEPAQLDHLGSSIGLVTFSIGGNDAGFSSIFAKCVTATPFSNCSGNKEVSERVDGAIDALAGKTTQDGIYSYDTIMSDIAARSPNATVVAVGYPRMFTPHGAGQILPVPGRCEGVTKVDQRWINAKTNEINAAAKAAAQRHGYRFADPSASFAGHELCGQQSSWFDGLINDGRFHPNAAGHKAIAGSIMGVLQEQPAATQELPAAAQAQVDNTRPAGSFTLARNGDQLALDASASTDSDGTIVNIDWYIQRADGSEEILTGTQATTTVPTDEQVVITAVITDNQGKEDFTTQIAPAA
mgnify:CR=1 FL=1